MGKFFKNQFFRNTFLIYLTVLGILTLIFLGGSVWQRQRSIQDKIQKEAYASAKLMVQMMDEKFNSISLVATQVAASGWYPYMASSSEILNSRVDYTRQKEIRKEIGCYNDLLQFAQSTAVLFPQRDIVLDRKSIWESGRYFSSIQRDDISVEDILSELEDNYDTLLLFPDISDGRNFYVVRKIEYVSTKGILFVLINERQFREFISTNMPAALSLEISANDSTVYSTGSPDSPEAAIQVSMMSDLFRWEYHFLIADNYYENFGLPPLAVGIIYCAVFITIIAVSFLMTLATYRPFIRLMERLNIKSPNDPYDLEKVFLELQGQKEGMEELANQYYQIGQHSFLKNLLLGTYDRKEIGELAVKFHSDFAQNKWYMVIIFSDNSVSVEDENQLAELLLKLQINCYQNSVAAMACNMDSQYALIMADKNGGQSLTEQSERIKVMVDDHRMASETEIYAGGVYTGFKGIHRSYEEARDKMVRNKNAGEQLVYYYPFDLEIGVNNYLRVGNFSEAEELIEGIHLENARRRVQPPVECKVIDLIHEDILRCGQAMGLDLQEDRMEYREMTENEETQQLWLYLKRLLAQLEQRYEARYKNIDLGGGIVEYVKANYTSSSLSQQDIADLFGVSRPTVSKLFKEAVNMNFIDYLHRLRVEKAKEMIQLGENDIPKIITGCGYDNEVTLNRAFVKYCGMTLREYRKTHRQQNA